MYTIGYDVGSSSVKVALVNHYTGKKIAVLQEPDVEMDILAPQPNWAEQDPEVWWQHICNGTQKIIKDSGVDPSTITAVGIAYQMHGLVIVDKKGKPLRNAIIWCDSRAVDIGNEAYSKLGHNWCAENLLNAPGNFTASKLKWVKENEPEVYKNVYKYMLPGDYIAYKLTGLFSTTKNGLAEGTLWNYKKNDLAVELLDHYGIDRSFTPKIVDNFTNQGKVTSEASEKTGLPVGATLRYRSGDQPNNALSLNILKPGEVAATGGTSGVVYAITDKTEFTEISKVNQFAHVNYKDDEPVVGRLLNINGCGIQYRWLKTNLGDLSYDEMNEKASKISVGSDGLVIIPFGNGAERMLDNRNIGTQMCNINLNLHTQAHIYRSSLEGIAFAFVYGMEILKNDNTQIDIIRAGNDNLFRSEIFAETVATLIGQEIEIYDTTGAVGAARAASIVNNDFTGFEKNITDNDYDRTYKPLENTAPYLEAYKKWKKQLQQFLIKKN